MTKYNKTFIIDYDHKLSGTCPFCEHKVSMLIGLAQEKYVGTTIDCGNCGHALKWNEQLDLVGDEEGDDDT